MCAWWAIEYKQKQGAKKWHVRCCRNTHSLTHFKNKFPFPTCNGTAKGGCYTFARKNSYQKKFAKSTQLNLMALSEESGSIPLYTQNGSEHKENVN